MRTILVLLFLFGFLSTGFTQKFTFGTFIVPNEALKLGEGYDEYLQMFSPDAPKPEVYYFETSNEFNVYILTFQANKDFDNCTAYRIRKQNITSDNFKSELEEKSNHSRVNIFTNKKEVIEMIHFFSNDLPKGDPVYSSAFQSTISISDKNKAIELNSLLNGLIKK